MYLRKKTGATVLALLTASAIAIPGAAFAASSVGVNVDPTVSAQYVSDDGTYISLYLDTDNISEYGYVQGDVLTLDFSQNNVVDSISVGAFDLPSGVSSVLIKARDSYTGDISLNGSNQGNNITAVVNGTKYEGISNVSQSFKFGNGVHFSTYVIVEPNSRTSLGNEVTMEGSTAVYDLRNGSKISSLDINVYDMPDGADAVKVKLPNDFDGNVSIIGEEYSNRLIAEVNGTKYSGATDVYTSYDFENGKFDGEYASITWYGDPDLDGEQSYAEIGGKNVGRIDLSKQSRINRLVLSASDIPVGADLMQVMLRSNYTGSVTYHSSDANGKAEVVIGDVCYSGVNGEYQTLNFVNGMPQGTYTHHDKALEPIAKTIGTGYLELNNASGYYELSMAKFAGTHVKDITSVKAYDANGNVITSMNGVEVSYKSGTLKVKGATPASVTCTYKDGTQVYNVSSNVGVGTARISGSSRYSTMVDLDESGAGKSFDGTFTENNGNVVVASGEGFADALSASALAGSLGTGIVTTKASGLDDSATAMLKSMMSHNIAYVVGGTNAVSSTVESQLKTLGFTIKRLAGDDRNATALAVEKQVQSNSSNDTVIIASSTGFADALSIAPYAYTQGTPIVLVGKDGSLETETSTLLTYADSIYENAIIVGGTAAVSSDVVDALKDYGLNVTRLSGSDRFETNNKINSWITQNSAENSFSGKNVYVATGTGFADALAAAPVAGVNGGTIALTKGKNISTAKAAISGGATPIIVGGTSAMTQETTDLIDALV